MQCFRLLSQRVISKQSYLTELHVDFRIAQQNNKITRDLLKCEKIAVLQLTSKLYLLFIINTILKGFLKVPNI